MTLYQIIEQLETGMSVVTLAKQLKTTPAKLHTRLHSKAGQNARATLAALRKTQVEIMAQSQAPLAMQRLIDTLHTAERPIDVIRAATAILKHTPEPPKFIPTEKKSLKDRIGPERWERIHEIWGEAYDQERAEHADRMYLEQREAAKKKQEELDRLAAFTASLPQRKIEIAEMRQRAAQARAEDAAEKAAKEAAAKAAQQPAKNTPETTLNTPELPTQPQPQQSLTPANPPIPESPKIDQNHPLPPSSVSSVSSVRTPSSPLRTTNFELPTSPLVPPVHRLPTT